MSEIRQNIATREWVIIATERAKRPEQFVREPRERITDRPRHAADCPFCPGNEELDLERLRLPESGDWVARVVENRFPALQSQGTLQPNFGRLGHALAGIGHHEVVVESRFHNTCPALESIEEVELTLRANRQRGVALHADPRVAQLIYFKNHGVGAGASLLHPHTQLLALPVVPHNIEDRIETAKRHYQSHGECVICRMRAEEQREHIRMLRVSEYFTAFVPYAALSPFHVWIVPNQHTACFTDVSDPELRDLAIVMRDVLQRLYVGLGDPDYNYVIRTAPRRERNVAYLHWYISIIPRIIRQAGFELGSGMYINTALPEASAEFLRNVRLDSEHDVRSF
jgi:UDPglucose--hexose-1-phosphate uridylyltransferase